jgi:hypothetical protein
MQETGENNAWRRFIVEILNQVSLEGRIKECEGGNCCGIDKEWIQNVSGYLFNGSILEHNIETDCTGI